MRGESPEDTAIDLVIEDGSRVGVAYFLMNENNVRREVALPWMSFDSDEAAPAPEGVFLLSHPHPRAYGSFARLLGHHVRDEHALTLAHATYADPHQLATGVDDVLVNGGFAFRDGKPTGAHTGRFVRGRAWTG